MDDFDAILGRTNLLFVQTSLTARMNTIKRNSPQRTDLINELQGLIDDLGNGLLCYETIYTLVRELNHEVHAVRTVNEQQRLEIKELSTKIKNMEDYYGNI